MNHEEQDSGIPDEGLHGRWDCSGGQIMWHAAVFDGSLVVSIQG